MDRSARSLAMIHLNLNGESMSEILTFPLSTMADDDDSDLDDVWGEEVSEERISYSVIPS